MAPGLHGPGGVRGGATGRSGCGADMGPGTGFSADHSGLRPRRSRSGRRPALQTGRMASISRERGKPGCAGAVSRSVSARNLCAAGGRDGAPPPTRGPEHPRRRGAALGVPVPPSRTGVATRSGGSDRRFRRSRADPVAPRSLPPESSRHSLAADRCSGWPWRVGDLRSTRGVGAAPAARGAGHPAGDVRARRSSAGRSAAGPPGWSAPASASQASSPAENASPAPTVSTTGPTGVGPTTDDPSGRRATGGWEPRVSTTRSGPIPAQCVATESASPSGCRDARSSSLP